jgi:uncharacterized protein YcbK (DUF882 family)
MTVVTGNRAIVRRRDLLLATGVCILLGGNAFAFPTGPRRLTLKNAHTGETFSGPYRDATGPLPSAIADLTVFLRDFHADKCGPVDVGMLDFLANVMTTSGQRSATVLSAYRTRETNERLRATQFGVAEQSQHLFGRAIDVTFDSRLSNVKQAALAMKQGGVGWYPASFFIHLDSGPARSWELGGAGFGRLLGGGSANGNRGEAPSPEENLLNAPRPDLLPMSEQLERADILARRELERARRCENPAIFDKRGCPISQSTNGGAAPLPSPSRRADPIFDVVAGRR